MKKMGAFWIIVFSSLAYGWHQHIAAAQTITISPTATPKPTLAPTATPTPTPLPTSTPTPIPSAAVPTTTTTRGQYKDGTYTGSVADAVYGNMQVAVVIQGGKITDVQFLQYPNDRSTSQFINSQAMPLLKQEAIQAQNANVDGVSGAPASSQAFIQSLGNALDQAKA